MNDELAIRLHRLDYVLTDKEIEKLRELCCEISSSWCPLIDFFNDIRTDKDKNYDKNQAFKDLWLIALIVVDRQEEHRVFNIIKDKMVNVGALYRFDLETYNRYAKLVNLTPTLTQEEYDLSTKALLEKEN